MFKPASVPLALLELKYADALLGKVPEETEAAVFALMDRLGAKAFLVKPFKKEELLATLAKIV